MGKNKYVTSCSAPSGKSKHKRLVVISSQFYLITTIFYFWSFQSEILRLKMHKGVLATRLFGQELMIAMPNTYALCRVANPYQLSSSITWPCSWVLTSFHDGGGFEQDEDGYVAFLWSPLPAVPWHQLTSLYIEAIKVKWGGSLSLDYIIESVWAEDPLYRLRAAAATKWYQSGPTCWFLVHYIYINIITIRRYYLYPFKWIQSRPHPATKPACLPSRIWTCSNASAERATYPGPLAKGPVEVWINDGHTLNLYDVDPPNTVSKISILQ